MAKTKYGMPTVGIHAGDAQSPRKTYSIPLKQSDDAVPSPNAGDAPVPVASAKLKRAPVPPVDTKDAPIPSTSTKDPRIPSKSTAGATRPSTSTENAPVPPSGSEDAPISSSNTENAPSVSTEDTPFPSTGIEDVSVPSTSVSLPSTSAGDASIPSAREKLPFHPFATLSKFIDSIPYQTYSEDDPIPGLVGCCPEYVQKADQVFEIIKHFPNKFVTMPRFFWKHELQLAKKDGKEILAGDGRFGSVFLAQNHHNEMFAVKYYKLEERQNQYELGDIINEAILQDKLAQRDVAPAIEGFGFISHSEKFYKLVLISQFIAAKHNCRKPLTLSALCQEDAPRRRNGYPPLLLSHQYLNLLVRIVNQHSRLSQCRVIHTDVKYDNILLEITKDGQQLRPYLIDFGSSFLERDARGPLYYLPTRRAMEKFLRRYPHFAPEFLYNPKAISNKSDLYGLGLVLRRIGNYLEIPALVSAADKLRLRNPGRRPNPESLRQMIQAAFGKKPSELPVRKQTRCIIPHSHNPPLTYRDFENTGKDESGVQSGDANGQRETSTIHAERACQSEKKDCELHTQINGAAEIMCTTKL